MGAQGVSTLSMGETTRSLRGETLLKESHRATHARRNTLFDLPLQASRLHIFAWPEARLDLTKAPRAQVHLEQELPARQP